MLHISRCCLHRTSCVIVRLFEKHKLDGCMICVSAFLRMRKTHQQVCDAYKDRCKRICANEGTPPPCSRRLQRIAVLEKMLTHTRRVWKPRTAAERSTNHDWDGHVELLLDGDQEGPWIPLPDKQCARHTCDGKCHLDPLTADQHYCSNPDAAVKLLAKSFDRVYMRTTPRFQTGRRTKMIPVLKKQAGG